MTSLYPFQREGAEWLSCKPRGYLADQMRLGKTPQAVEAWNNVFRCGDALTIVCPASLRLNWRRELNRWSWIDYAPQVLSYEAVVRDGLPHANGYVFDEAHYLSSPTAKRTRACLGLDDDGVMQPNHPLAYARHVWALSGTPGNPTQMWTWLRVFGATDLGWSAWTERYCHTRWTDYGLQVLGLKMHMAPELKGIMGPWFKRRTTADVGLPQARWGVLSVICGVDNVDHSARRYVDPEGDALPDPDEYTATLMRKLGERKVAPILEVMRQELDSGELDKIVIFAWHRNVIAGLVEGLKKYGAVRIVGGMGELWKQINLDRFDNDPACRVLVAQHEAGGVGLDFSAAADVLLAELSWNPDDNAQAAARVLGPRQKRPVMVRVAASEDPLDYAIARVTARKNATLNNTWS